MPASAEETVVNKTKHVIFMEFVVYLLKLATPHSLSFLLPQVQGLNSEPRQ